MPTKQRPLNVFISYASQDELAVREVYNALKFESWMDPWLDKEKILPGQDWRTVIDTAVEEADVVIVCLSRQSVSKEGFVQREIRYSYEMALEKPEGTIFLIPLRLDACDIPRNLRSLQRLDYFGAQKNDAYSDLLQALKLRYEQKLGIKVEDVAIQEAMPASASKTRRKDPGQKDPPAADHHKKEQGRKSTRPRSTTDPAIIAAFIGVAGTIIVTLITLYANRPALPPTPSPSATVDFTFTVTEPLAPTETVTPPEITVTSVPPTHTVVPAPTGIPPVPLGEDWIAGCISTVWMVYPSDIPAIEKGNGCWREPLHIFSAENGDLDFLAERRNAPSEIYGLFAALPETGTVTFSVRLRDLTNVDLWMGIFAETEVNSQGLLMIIPSGDLKKRPFVQKNPQNYENIASTSLVPLENGFSISFSFDENSARSVVNPSVFFTNSISIPSSQKWLFLGYKGLRGSYRVDGTFLSFELK